jgi:hypothetical protein
LFERDLDGLRKSAQAAEVLLVPGEFGERGEFAVEKKVGDFFKLAVRGEREDVIAAVVEVVAGAANGAESGVAGCDTGEGNGFFWFEGDGFGGFNGHGYAPSAAKAASFGFG